MIVNVGSKNRNKIGAVGETISSYAMFKNAKVNGVKVPSNVSNQPKSLAETIRGARNRAKNAFAGCDYSFGLESGLMKVPFTKTGYMDVTACAIFDGKKFHLGLSSAFEYPPKIMKFIIEENAEVDDAAFKSGFTKHPDIGTSHGVIGRLTKGRLKRKEYTKQAVVMALVHLENPELYGGK